MHGIKELTLHETWVQGFCVQIEKFWKCIHFNNLLLSKNYEKIKFDQNKLCN